MSEQERKVRLVIRITHTVDMNDSNGCTPQLSFIKTSILTPEKAKNIAAILNRLEAFRASKLGNTQGVLWIINATDTYDLDRITSQFGLDELKNLPEVLNPVTEISLNNLN